jgi:hypothetical protein
MSVPGSDFGHATVFVVLIALGQVLMVQSAGQTTQQSQLDPSGGVLKPHATGPTPGTTAGEPSRQPLEPGVTTSSEPDTKARPPATPDGQQTATRPDVSSDSGRSQVVNESAATTGLQVFIDPATGQITEPTDVQLQELNQQRQAGNVSFGQAEVLARPGLVSGVTVGVPTSLFPMATATIGADGKVNLEERQSEPGATDAISQRPRVEQSLRAQAGQHLGAAGDEQPLRSGADQRLGPDGDYQHLQIPRTAAVTVTIVNLDAAGEGFNDPTAVAPVFGNPGTTRGAQRLNAFRAAAEYWGALLRSPVPIQVDAKMDPLPCTPTSAVLGSAGPNTAHGNFAGAPVRNTWYVQATANSRAGVDLEAESDIGATFNSDVDNPACLGAFSWWYGIGAPAPAGTVDFFDTVLHEIGHGIGVLTLVDLTTGAQLAGFDDAYSRWLWDSNLGPWSGLTNGQRSASAISGQVTFRGPRATEAARGFLSSGLDAGYARIFAPNPVQPGSSISHFDTVLTPNELMEPFATPPPGPYSYMTSGLLEDVGWRLLANGVFDFGASGTWTWNPVDGWAQRMGGDPSILEPWNGNFVGVYAGTWLWNGTTQSWSQLTPNNADHLKACGNNLLWASAADGIWRWNSSTGWALLSAASPESLDCLGGDAVWEGATGTWIYTFSTGVSSPITPGNPTGVLPCGSRLVWWQAGAGGVTWYWEAASGWHFLRANGPETTACYRGQLAWEGAAGPGTWLFDFTTGAWTHITANDPEQMLPWGPNLVWENAATGTWIFDGAAWTQISPNNPTHIEILGADLLYSSPGATWVWGGGGGGAGWTQINNQEATEIVSTGAVR